MKHARRQHLTAARTCFIVFDREFEIKAKRGLYRRDETTTSRRRRYLCNLWMGLTQNHDDVFDERMHGGEDLRATLNCHANHDNQR